MIWVFGCFFLDFWGGGGASGGSQIFFSIGILIFLLLSSKTVAQTLLGETAHFGICPPQIGFFWGPGGVPKILFSLESYFFSYLGAPPKFQNCSTNPSGRNSPFWLLSAQNRLFRGVGGVPKICFSLEASNFCVLGPHAKN